MSVDVTLCIPGPMLKSAKEIGRMLLSAPPHVKSPQLQRSPRVSTNFLWLPSPPLTAPSEPLPRSAAVGRSVLYDDPGFALSHVGLNCAGSGNSTAMTHSAPHTASTAQMNLSLIVLHSIGRFPPLFLFFEIMFARQRVCAEWYRA
jgi:hypothetical protein